MILSTSIEDLLTSGKLQNHWTSDFRAWLSRVGLDREFFENSPELNTVPTECLSYLQSNNPRLHEIREAISLGDAAACSSSVWTEKFVKFDLPLQLFRGDCALIWQKRDLNPPIAYALTYYYLLSRGLRELLHTLTEDNLFGVYTTICGETLVTRDRLDSTCEISFILDNLKWPPTKIINVLDIGSGYGRFAYRATQAFPNVTVFCTDTVPEVIFLCEFYLRFRGAAERTEISLLTDVRDMLKHRKMDIAVNVHSFSECCLDAIAWWLALISDNDVRYLFLVPNCHSYSRSEIFSLEPSGTRRNFWPIITALGYDLIARGPKYADPIVQMFGVSPTEYFLFENRALGRNVGRS